MKSYQVEDVYLLMYGLLVLIDERDESLFDYGVNTGMLKRACIDLDWYYGYDFNKSKEVANADYFVKHYEYDQKKYTVNAIIYDTSGYVMPRQIISVKSKVRLRARDQGFVDGFMTAAHFHHNDVSDEGSHVEEELVKLTRENKKLRESLEKLKKENYQVASKNKGAQSAYQKMKHDYDTLLNETARLREIIFHQEDEDLKDEVIKIKLPYQVKENVLVYGGHKSWNKNMKLRFIGPIEFMLSGARPAVDYLRHFDVIFFQIDSVGHDDYYYLIDAVRRYDLNFHYFTMRGVKACTKELIDYEER
jgi:hypothetical protein